ncbi:phage portal protein [Mangrovibacter sp. SLW1]
MFFPGLFRKGDAPVTTPAALAEDVGYSWDTYTGKRVSSQKAMRLTAVFGCIRVLSESIGMLPCSLYRSVGKGKEKATSERLYKLLSLKPNDYMTPRSFGSWWCYVCACVAISTPTR